MNVLVTGGAGYIGSVVTSHLVQAGHSVVVLDNLSHGHRAAVPKHVELVECSISDRPRVAEILTRARVDAVMHFAALIEVGESMLVPERYFRNNTANTLALLETMLEHKVNKF